eukprot:TRINITY_DN25501_c0_g1_i1.p1 TRINITY_DN25501_c0_g1~~TRINITY_DN25501_c0_g1_i1.p1  ORF type:complete len:113 (-),score=6.69 TRINITY_DN25501_c0_g1_i1:96-434(-)
MSDHAGHDLIRRGAPSVLFLSLLFGQELPVFLSVDRLSFFVFSFLLPFLFLHFLTFLFLCDMKIECLLLIGKQIHWEVWHQWRQARLALVVQLPQSQAGHLQCSHLVLLVLR